MRGICLKAENNTLFFQIYSIQYNFFWGGECAKVLCNNMYGIKEKMVKGKLCPRKQQGPGSSPLSDQFNVR